MDASRRTPAPVPAVLVVLGIVLASFNLRPAVTGLSPLLDRVADTIPVDPVFLAVIGMTPAAAFALGGIVTPRIIAALGTRGVVVLAMALVVVGSGLRILVPNASVFLLLSAVALIGMGVGNVVVPPLIKERFPQRVAPLTTVYVLSMQVGAFVPAFLAVPLADLVGWRGSLGAWVVTAAAALLLWSALGLLRGRRGTPGSPRPAGAPAHASEPSPAGAEPSPAGPQSPAGAEAPSAAEAPAPLPGRGGYRRLLRTPRAWALLVMTGLTSFNYFVLFTWLPLLVVRAGRSEEYGGAMLGVLTVLPVILIFVIPPFAARVRTPVVLVWVLCGFLGVGYAGLWLAPAAAPLLWTVLLGAGLTVFHVALTLINLRSAGPAESAALSGFVQGGGYVVASTGPLVFALLIGAGSEDAAFVLVLATVLVMVAVARPACREGFI